MRTLQERAQVKPDLGDIREDRVYSPTSSLHPLIRTEPVVQDGILTSIISSGRFTVQTKICFPAVRHSSRNLDVVGEMGRRYEFKNTYFSPSAEASVANLTENTWQSSQKYFLDTERLAPIWERRQYGKCFFAGAMKPGCHNPRRMRGASAVSQSGCWEMISLRSLNSCSGSLLALTSTLNLTCMFSG